jgi:hypothetical protein
MPSLARTMPTRVQPIDNSKMRLDRLATVTADRKTEALQYLAKYDLGFAWCENTEGERYAVREDKDRPRFLRRP